MLDGLLEQAVSAAHRLGLTEDELLQRLACASDVSKRLTLVEPDSELVRIILFEIECAGRKAPKACSLPEELFPTELQRHIAGTTPVVLPSKAALVRVALGETVRLIVLRISPVAGSMAEHLLISREHLVAVVSHWPRFLEIARAMLISSGFAPEACYAAMRA